MWVVDSKKVFYCYYNNINVYIYVNIEIIWFLDWEGSIIALKI